jgi:hypothetical protein
MNIAPLAPAKRSILTTLRKNGKSLRVGSSNGSRPRLLEEDDFFWRPRTSSSFAQLLCELGLKI